MAVFEYRGLVAASGKSVKGVRDADNAKALRAALKREGVLLTDASESKAAAVKGGSGSSDLFAVFRSVSVADVASMTRQLATLVGAGIPLVESMNALSEQSEKMELLRVLTAVRDRINEGTSFAMALEEHPKVFPALYVNMVAAGEASGTLEKVLDRLAEFLEDQARLRGKVSAALAYPILMACLGGGLLVIMMTVIVPKVTSIFASLDRALPWYTSLLITVSDALTSSVTLGALPGFAGYLLLRAGFRVRKAGEPSPKIFRIFGFAASALALVSLALSSAPGLFFVGLVCGILLGIGIGRYQGFVATPKGTLWKDGFVLKLPLFGKLLQLVAVARFSRTLGTLLTSGVSLLKALEITRNVLDNAVLQKVVEEAAIQVREGKALSVPLKASAAFPTMSVHMIAVGERSGELEAMLDNVAKEYDRQVETRIQTMTSLLEPLIMVTMGLGVGFITFAILMPLIQMNDAF